MIEIICPTCKAKFRFPLKPGINALRCAKCKRELKCDLIRVRAKRSRGYRTGFDRVNREFNIRVIDPQGERLIQFVTAGWDDFELRSKDQVIFTYVNDKLRLLQNLTIGLYYDVVDPVDSVGVIIVGILVVIVAALIIGFIAASNHR